MFTLASAAALIEGCDSAAAAAPLLAGLGFDSGLFPLAGAHISRLGLAREIRSPHLAQGRGSLRALSFEAKEPGHVREELGRVAGHLARHAPEMLWIVVAVDVAGGETALAAVELSSAHARLAALVATRNRIVDSDAETLCSLAAAVTSSDVLTHCRWLEILGRESLGRNFFRALQHTVSKLSASLHPAEDEATTAELALLYVSRLLFLSFLETRGLLDGDHGFLANRYSDCMMSGGRFHQRVLSPLFFGTLNTSPRNRAPTAIALGRIPFLNGGLFSRTPAERRVGRARFSDEALGDVFGELLCRYRFTAREDSARWTEAAIDPEMLGRAFEGLMSSRERKLSGAFFTPQSLVAETTAAALSHTLASGMVPASVAAAALGGENVGRQTRVSLLDAIDRITVLDPACGSGAFLIECLEELSTLSVRLGDTRQLHQIRRHLLTRSIFGVDVNPTAVWLCELRLWLSMAIEDPETNPMRFAPLPNLDRNIRVGDSLSGDAFGAASFSAGGRTVARLRERYARATGPRKRSIARSLDHVERGQAIVAVVRRLARMEEERRDILEKIRARDLFGDRARAAPVDRARLSELRSRLRETRGVLRRLSEGGALPFSFASGFADVAAAAGFDLVIGNPPWVRTHRLDVATRASLRSSFRVYRRAAWKSGRDASAAGSGFASQVDAAALFIERSVDLLRPGGLAALVVPAKLWRSLAGGGVRELMQERTVLRELHDLSGAKSIFDAAVYPSVVIAARSNPEQSSEATMVVHRQNHALRWKAAQSRLPFDGSPGSPWIILPRDARRAFDTLRSAGEQLGATSIGRPLLGVKTGCNDAFLVHRDESVDSPMLRPVIRGEQVTPWRLQPSNSRIIWTHDDAGRPLKSLPPEMLQRLTPWRRDLELRTDARGKPAWWALFRVESADTSCARVVWSDIGRRPRAALIPEGDRSVPINSCYVARCDSAADALTLVALINSDVVAAWLDVIAEPARGGYRRYMGWTMSILPVPRDWKRARSILAPIAHCATGGRAPDQLTLRHAVLDAYGVTESSILPLLEWERTGPTKTV
ncbi:MAG: Eco57I restriction-modification methylase domain-containing protein [Gemmatimonadaceae bacterium]